MRLGVWTSGRSPVPAVVAAIRQSGLALDHLFCSDEAGLANLQEVAGEIPCHGPATDPTVLLARPALDCILLLSYPHLLGPELLERQLFLNCHNSLLPAYRGLHAFTWALLHGESQLGYTLHRVEGPPDAGPILCQRAFQVGLDETINDVFRKADALLPEWIPESLLRFSHGELGFSPQDESRATRVRRRTVADGRIDWNRPALAIHNLIRSQAPPYTTGAFTYADSLTVILGRSAWSLEPATCAPPGTLLDLADDGSLLVQCADRPLRILEYWSRDEWGGQIKFLRHVGRILT